MNTKRPGAYFTSDVTSGEFDLIHNGNDGWYIVEYRDEEGRNMSAYWLRNKPPLPFTVTVYVVNQKGLVTATHEIVVSSYEVIGN